MSEVQTTGYYHAEGDKFATSFNLNTQVPHGNIMHGNDWTFMMASVQSTNINEDGSATVQSTGVYRTVPYTGDTHVTCTWQAVRNSETNPAGEIGFEIKNGDAVVHSNPLQPLQYGTVTVSAAP